MWKWTTTAAFHLNFGKNQFPFQVNFKLSKIEQKIFIYFEWDFDKIKKFLKKKSIVYKFDFKEKILKTHLKVAKNRIYFKTLKIVSL